MPLVRLTRRETLLTLSTVGLISLSGCPSPYRRNPAGRLTITNNRGQEHTVTLVVTKTSHNPEDWRDQASGRRRATPSSEVTPVWTREQTFTIGPRGEIVEEQYFDEAGSFHVHAHLDTGETDSNWLGLTRNQNDELVGREIWVSIPATGFMTVSAIADD